MCCAEGEALLAPSRLPPSFIVDLLARNNAIAKEFKQGVRSYNSALSFTSTNVDLDRRYANERHTDSNPNHAIQQPRFAQIYIFDSENELQNRLNVAGNSNVRPHTIQLLQNMMHDVSLFADIFKTMEELSSEQPNGIEDIRIIFRAENDTNIRRCNAPTANEIGVLIVGGENESSI